MTPRIVLVVVGILILVAAAVIFARHEMRRMTLGTFYLDDSGRASYSGVFEFEQTPNDIRDRKFIILRVQKKDLSLPNERNRRNDSSYYGGFNNQEERGKANER